MERYWPPGACRNGPLGIVAAGTWPVLDLNQGNAAMTYSTYVQRVTM